MVMTTKIMKIDMGAPTVFGDEVLAHPQPQLQSSASAKVLEECATKLALRIGDGMEDVSFREFIDLVLAVSSNDTCLENVEKYSAPENRSSSVLRKVYFSSLSALHKIEDPPTKEDPPAYTSTNSTSMVFLPEDENVCLPPLPQRTITKQPITNEDCDRPPPMDPLSHASTSSTGSSWSSISAPGSMGKQNINYNATPSTANDSTVEAKLPFSSFHFVSQFDDDDDDDETLNDENEMAIAANNYDGSSTDGGSDKSMVVFVEENEEGDVKNWSHRPATVAPTNRKKTQTTTIQLPHDFEVVTIVSVPGSPSSDASSSNRARTYSVTTTASSSSFPKRGIRERAWTADAVAVSRSKTKLKVTAKSSTKKPAGIEPSGRSRSDGASVTGSISSKFRRMLTLRSKSTGNIEIKPHADQAQNNTQP